MIAERIKDILRAMLAEQLEKGGSFAQRAGQFSQNEWERINDEYEQLFRQGGGRRDQQQSHHHGYKQQHTHQTHGPVDKERQYYADLELPVGAPFPEIKKAYRRMVKLYHPDRFAADKQKHSVALQVTLRINEAYHYFERKFNR